MKKAFPVVVPFLVLSILALFMGLWAGLVRLGWPLPVLPGSLPMQHGPLMVSGFLGTMIALERVVAIRQRWMFAAPFFSGAGWVLSLALPALQIGPLLITLGSLFTTGILLHMVLRETKIYTITMAIGALCWLIGNVLWLFGTPVFLVVWWWAAFLVLTIAGERLELSRVLRFKRQHYQLFALAAAIFLSGVGLYTWLPEVGARVSGAGMLALAAWLLRYDIARRNIRRTVALPRYIATCLFSGYLWLAFSGILSLLFGAQYAGLLYDAILHSVFVGFVLSMIFGHAPIIVPALTQIKVFYNRSFYLPVILLHASLILRIAGDLAGSNPARMWGGILNEIALLAFLAIFVTGAARQRQTQAAAKLTPLPKSIV